VLTPTAAGRATLRSRFPAGVNPRVDRLLDLTSGAVGVANPTLIDLGAGRPGVEFGRAVTSFAQSFVEPQLQAHIDHKVSETSQLSARYPFADQNAPVGGAALGLPGFTTSQANRFQNFLISETHVFSPSVTNELRLSYNRIALAFPLDPPNELGLTLPNITIAGVSNVSGATYNIGIQTNLPQGRVANNYVIQDTISYLRGAHTFRGGFDLLKQRSRQFAPINERGSLIYNAGGGFTGLANFIDDVSGSGGSANRDFGSPAYYPELFRQAYFFQDRWRVNEALTLTLGVRYENFGNHTRSHRPGDGALHRFGCGKRAHRHARTQHRADEGNQQLRLHGAKRGPSPRRTENPLPHRILQHLQPPAIWVRKHQPLLTERGGAVGQHLQLAGGAISAAAVRRWRRARDPLLVETQLLNRNRNNGTPVQRRAQASGWSHDQPLACARVAVPDIHIAPSSADGP